MPSRIVMISPPGSRPGISSFASEPPIKPTSIQAMMFIPDSP